MAAPREHLVRRSDVVAVDPCVGLSDVRPTGGLSSSRTSRLVAGVGWPEDLGLDGAEGLDLVVANAYAAGCGRRGSVHQKWR